jgi:hypothetical protein
VGGDNLPKLTRPALAAGLLLVWTMFVWSPISFSRSATLAAQEKAGQPSRLLTVVDRNIAEEFSFSITDFKMDHQDENNVLNITVQYAIELAFP